jgi:hypothetical protein
MENLDDDRPPCEKASEHAEVWKVLSMKQRLIALTFGLGLLGSTSLWAHHSLAAEYDQKKPVSLTGTLTKLDWRNPHAWIYMDVKNASGGIDKWECELGSPNAMTRAGFTQDSVKLGDEIVLDGILAKKGTNICSTRTVKAKDGRTVLSQTEGAR